MFVFTASYCRFGILCRRPYFGTDTQHSHSRLTCRALKNRPGPHISGLDHDMQNHLDQLQQFFGIAMQKAIVPDPTKPLWQNMLHNEPEKAAGGTPLTF
jgi:hypothetical protein